MKRINLYGIVIMSTMIMVGCQDDFDGVLTARIEDYNGGNGKVYIEEDNAVGALNYACWHNGDMVKVNGVDCPIVIASAGGNATINVSAQYENGVTSFTAIYPASMVAEYSERHCSLNLPKVHTYQERMNPNGGMVQMVEAPMMAYTRGSEMKFYNTGALVKVVVYNKKDVGIRVQRIDLMAMSTGTKLWGKARIQQSLGGIPLMSIVEHGGNTLQLSIPNNMGMIAENQHRAFYIAIPAIRSRFRLGVQYIREGDATESTMYERESNVENDIPRNSIAVMHVELK